jgi:hypothetical protein
MKNCPYYLEYNNFNLQRNALRVEIITPLPRCLLKPPDHWSERAKEKSLHWVLSGGDILVFDYCTNCNKYIGGKENV